MYNIIIHQLLHMDIDQSIKDKLQDANNQKFNIDKCSDK